MQGTVKDDSVLGKGRLGGARREKLVEASRRRRKRRAGVKKYARLTKRLPVKVYVDRGDHVTAPTYFIPFV